MWEKIKFSITPRGCFAFLAFGFGLIVSGSEMLITYLVGGVFILLSFGILLYNWKYPVDDYIPSMSESTKNSKIVWGLWHTGNRARNYFFYGSVEKVLLLEPNPNSEAFKHVLAEVSGRPTTQHQIFTEINLTRDEAFSKQIKLRWHNEITSQSFMICDSSPKIEGDLVTFSKRAYVVVQVLDRNLNIEEWSKYKKTMTKDKYAFEAYVKWFKDVWDNKSKTTN
jgi:hypothetical protein